MVKSQFGTILKEFEIFFNCPLEPDTNDSCLVKMGIGLNVQLEIDRYGLLLIGCRIGVLPMSRYRDNLIKEALKSNEATLPSTGIFGFSKKSNNLILFVKLYPESLTANQILTIMPTFIAKAKEWTEAVAKSEIPEIKSSNSKNTPSGLFGLISK